MSIARKIRKNKFKVQTQYGMMDLHMRLQNLQQLVDALDKNVLNIENALIKANLLNIEPPSTEQPKEASIESAPENTIPPALTEQK